MQNYYPNFNPEYKSLNGENKVMVLLLVIFLFGLLILSMNKNKPCGCTRKVVYREKGYNPYVISDQDEIPQWAVDIKRKNMN